MSQPSDGEPSLWDALVQRQLKQLPPATTLSSQQLARIERVLAEAEMRPVRSRATWLVASAALLALSAVAIFGLRSRTSASGALIVPAGAIARIVSSTQAQLVVVGQATMTHTDGARPTVRDGRVIARSGEQPLEVDVPEGRIAVAPHSTIVIEVRGSRTRVAAYAGRASLAWQQFADRVNVGAGTELNATGVATVSESERREAESLLEPTTSREVPAAHQIASTPTLSPTTSSTSSAHRSRAHATTETSIAPDRPPATSPIAAKSTSPSEVEIVATAVRALNSGDPAAALRSIDEYWLRHPGGELAPEGETVAVEALLQLGRRTDALSRLDAMSLGARTNGHRLLILRGELRAERGRCHDAVADFASAVLADDAQIRGRAYFGRGVCRARLGDGSGARDDYASSVHADPSGPAAEAARRALQQTP